MQGGYLGPASLTDEAFPLAIQGLDSSDVEASITGTPTWALYGPAFGTALETGTFGASDTDSKTGFRTTTIDFSAISGLAAGDLVTIRCSYVVSSAKIVVYTVLMQ